MFFTIFWIVFIGCLGISLYQIVLWAKEATQRLRDKMTTVMTHVAEQYHWNIGNTPEDFELPAWEYPYIQGKLQDCPIELFIETRAAGEDINHYLTIHINIPYNFYFELYRNNFMGRTFFGTTEITFGDKAFEKTFIIRSTHSQIKQVFDTTVRQKAIELKQVLYNSRLLCRNQKITIFQMYEYPPIHNKENVLALIQFLEAILINIRRLEK